MVRSASILLRGAPAANLANQPLRVLTIDHEGSYSTFCPELRGARSGRFDDFVMGNVARDSLADIQDHPVFRAVAQEIAAGRDACRNTCEYWAYCGGGDPSSKFFEHGRFDVTETATCRIHKQATVDAILDVLSPGPNPFSWIPHYGRDRPAAAPEPRAAS